MNRPTVSIIIPCYNTAQYLRETLDSAIRQSYPALEILVIDDGSTDGSGDIAAAYGGAVRVIRQHNQGESVARNVGIDAAQGTYLLFLDSDDLLDPSALERLADAVAERPGSVAIMGCHRFESDASQPYKTTFAGEGEFIPLIFQGNPNPPHCWLMPRQVVIDAGKFDVTMRFSEDWDFLGRVALTGAPLVRVAFAGAYYRRHPTSQRATVQRIECVRADVVVLDRMIQKALLQEPVVNRHGTPLFWSGSAAHDQAMEFEVPAAELASLEQGLEELAWRGPPELKRSVFSRLIRLLGYRNATRLRKWFVATKRYSD